MDTNGTRYRLLQGEADWSRWRVADGSPAAAGSGQLAWDAARGEITLWPLAFRFPAGRDDRPAQLAQRRGAALDAFGNAYWIGDDGRSIQVRGEGDDRVAPFWPVPAAAPETEPGDFAAAPVSTPAATPAPAPPRLQGLVVTDDHRLIAGRLDPPGLLVFDLAAGGAPEALRWPSGEVAGGFEPFDLAPRIGGGCWVLDRRHRRLWPLDRRLEVVTNDCDPPADDEPGFAPRPPVPGARPRVPLRAAQGRALVATDPLAIDTLPDGAVVVLDTPGADGFARLWLVEPDGLQRAASTADLARHLAQGTPPGTPSGAPSGTAPSWPGHDLAVLPREADDPPHWRGRVHLVGADGNQAMVFGLLLDGATLVADALPLYQPMRLFGGRALVAAGGRVFYDCGTEPRFVPLVAQPRPRWVEQGGALTPVLDGEQPGCVWHRVLIDGAFPPGTQVGVESRASDDWRVLIDETHLSPAERAALGPPPASDPALLPEPAWQREPDPVRRSSGAELPWARPAAGAHRGTLETLLQRAHGRFVQLRLTLRGDGRHTPRIAALRAHFPRFSYLREYLPAVYRDDADSAHFLDRFLANPEGLLTTLEDRIAAAQWLWDPRSAPPEALDWLAGWFGVLMDPAWSEARRRFFLRHATAFFARRGTLPGLRAALALALDDCEDEALFAALRRGLVPERPAALRIVEAFRRRHTPAALLGAQAVDGGTALPGAADPVRRWNPAMGGAELLRRWQAEPGTGMSTAFPLVAPADAARAAQWRAFGERELGFVPQSAAESATGGAGGPLRRRWQDFLARRYRQIGELKAAWARRDAAWTRFADVPLPRTLPPDGAALADWCRFEGTALAMQRHAHRFTVLLPVPPRARTELAAQQRRLQLAERVLAVEKPAHTVFELRFYWAAFRLGAARLGADTLVDLGSRAPELMRPMVLGDGAIGQTHLAARAGHDAAGRLQIGRDRLGRSTVL